MENASKEADGFYNLELKRQIWWIIFAPLALLKINNELCLFWIVGSILSFMVLNIYSHISKPAMFILAYMTSIFIVIFALLIRKIKKNS